MNNNELIEFIKSNKSNYMQKLKAYNYDLFNLIDKKYNFKTFAEKVYNFLYGDNVGRCEVCGNKCTFLNINRGYTKTCSLKCSYLSNSRKETTEKTNLKKYGVKYTFQSDVVKDKIKQSNLNNLGVEYPSQNENVKQKREKTYLEKYGVKNPAQSTEIRNKMQKTLFGRYNVKHPLQSQLIHDRVKHTNKEKYGEEIYVNSNDFKNKTKETCMKRYGCSNALRNKQISEQKLRTYLNNQYDYLLNEKYINANITPLFSKEEYIGTEKRRYNFKCDVCNTKFDYLITKGRIPLCPKCNPNNVSTFEDEIVEYIKSIYNGEIKLHDRTIIKNGFELDIYLPELKIAFECDGIYWHSELVGKGRKYHLNKTNICEEQGIQLIHIFENEWELMSNQVKNKIKKLLHIKNDNTVYARNCIVKEITTNEKNDFLNNNHLQRSDHSSIFLGSFYNDVLVAVMTFSHPRLGISKSKEQLNNTFELVRFCVGDINVIGIASKLFKYFIKKYNPLVVHSYANRRYSWVNSAFYPKLGFNFISYSNPTYWYFKGSEFVLYHRFNYRKDILNKKLKNYNPELTEWENMKNNGFNRIWDCGTIKYTWKATI